MEFMDEEGEDERMLEAVRAFNPYDLYSKSDEVPKTEVLKVSFSFLERVLFWLCVWYSAVLMNV